MFRRRKKTFRRSFRPRGAPLARKRRTWIQSLLVDPCEPELVALCNPDDQTCCTTRFVQVVVENSLLQERFSDRATVRRILGNLQVEFNPDLAGAPDVDGQYARLAAAFGSLYVQLIKRSINSTGDAELPPEIWNSTSVIEGYSESRALKTWWHHWFSNDVFELELGANQAAVQTQWVWKPQLQMCLVPADACISPNQLTNGNGYTWEVNGQHADGVILTGECTSCGEYNPSQVVNTGKLKLPRIWNFAFDIKKRIALREDEQLVLDFQFRSPFNSLISGGTNASIGVQAGGIKTLLEF